MVTRQLLVQQSPTLHWRPDKKIEKIEAKNEEEALQEAYLKYKSQIGTALYMYKEGEDMFWLPVDFTLEDEDDKDVDLIFPEDMFYHLTPEQEEFYKEFMGANYTLSLYESLRLHDPNREEYDKFMNDSNPKE